MSVVLVGYPAVSYTHLDVYKRQVYTQGRINDLGAQIYRISVGDGSPEPSFVKQRQCSSSSSYTRSLSVKPATSRSTRALDAYKMKI